MYVYVCMFLLATHMSCKYTSFNTNKRAFNIFGTANLAYLNMRGIIFSNFGSFQMKLTTFLQSSKALKTGKMCSKQKLNEAEKKNKEQNAAELSITSADIYFQISELINKHCVCRILHFARSLYNICTYVTVSYSFS